MKIALPSIVFLLLLFSCSPRFDVQELQGLSFAEAGPIQLTPSFELFDWRYDIIRQEDSYSDAEGNFYTSDRDYHPIGFNLGNGLFIDMNDNLSFRIDQLLGIDYSTGATIDRIVSRRSGPAIIENYQLTTDAHCITRQLASGKERERCSSYEISEKGVILQKRNTVRSILRFAEDAIEFPTRSKRYHSLTAGEPGQYEYRLHTEGSEKVIDIYEQYERELYLRNRFLLQRTEAGDEINISRIHSRGNTLLYTMYFSEDRIVVFKPNRTGFTINFEDNGLHIRATNGEALLYRHRDESGFDDLEEERGSSR